MTRIRPRARQVRADREEVCGGREHRIVVGVDGSPSSLEALRWAAGQAALTSSVVDAVIAWRDPASYGGYAWLIADTRYAEFAARTLREAVDRVITGGSVAVRQRVMEGPPARVLLHAAHGADLLVVGSHGHGGFAGMLLGSVSQHCVHHSPCPVVVVREHERSPGKAGSTAPPARSARTGG